MPRIFVGEPRLGFAMDGNESESARAPVKVHQPDLVKRTVGTVILLPRLQLQGHSC
jgi:hypothetical protein